jgi:hypothetical protein
VIEKVKKLESKRDPEDEKIPDPEEEEDEKIRDPV